METAIIMLTLTMLGDGQISGAFVATEGTRNCEQRAKAVRNILTAGGVEILKLACLEGKVSFEKFVHNTPEDAPRYHYLVRYDDNTVEVVAATGKADCLEAVQENTGSDQTHCVSSTQKPVRP